MGFTGGISGKAAVWFVNRWRSMGLSPSPSLLLLRGFPRNSDMTVYMAPWRQRPCTGRRPGRVYFFPTLIEPASRAEGGGGGGGLTTLLLSAETTTAGTNGEVL